MRVRLPAATGPTPATPATTDTPAPRTMPATTMTTALPPPPVDEQPRYGGRPGDERERRAPPREGGPLGLDTRVQDSGLLDAHRSTKPETTTSPTASGTASAGDGRGWPRRSARSERAQPGQVPRLLGLVEHEVPLGIELQD